MLDIKKIREDYEGVKERVEFRGKGDFGIAEVKRLDEERRKLLAEVETMKHRQNTVSREIPKLKKAGEDTASIMAEMKELSGRIKEMNGELSQIEDELRSTLLGVPNTPAEGVPFGKDDADNVEMRKWGEPTSFAFEPRLIGISARNWISWISSVRPKLRVRVSRCTKDWAPDWRERSRVSCWIFIHWIRTIRRYCRPSWSIGRP